MTMIKRNLIWMAPLAMLGMIIFAFIGGEIVKLLWNWLAPELFGLRRINFWEAFGLLALCRILFGGFGGGCRSGPRRRMSERMRERMRQRMGERWDQMTPEERERFRQGFPGRGGQTTPLNSTPGTNG